jgi:hypothetical protein
MRLRSLSLLLAAAAVLFAADDAPLRDRIIYKAGPPADVFEVIAEGAEEVFFKVTPQSQPTKKKTREILRIDYGGMRQDGHFKAGLDALARGRYDEAADRFQAAQNGSKEWEKVYGAMEEGESLELARKYADAAKAFAVVADGKPYEGHRLRLDAVYRKGMALALAKDAGAEKVAAALSELAKGKVGQPAEARASAIRAAFQFASGNAGKFEEFSKKATLRSDEAEVWAHFNLWLADAYHSMKKSREASRVADGMLNAMEKDPQLADPARKIAVLTIKGLALMESDPQGALIELIRIDALPYGSEDQKCEARYNAGRLLLAEAKALEAQPDTAKDDKKSTFVAEQRTTAKQLLSAAAGSLSTKPSKAEAQKLLATLP